MNVISASVEEINAAAEAAAAVFYPYSRSAPALRARFLRAIAQGIEGLGSTLIDCAARETALAEARLVGERGRTCAQLRMFADIAEANQWIDECVEAGDPALIPQPKPAIRARFVPLGPVVVFGASNFPLGFCSGGRRHGFCIGGGLSSDCEGPFGASADFRAPRKGGGLRRRGMRVAQGCILIAV